MSRIKFLGLPPEYRQGDVYGVEIPLKNGTIMTVLASDHGKEKYSAGDDIGIDLTDEWGLTVMANDPSYQIIS